MELQHRQDKFFSPLSFVVAGSEMVKKIKIRDKHPGSATLFKSILSKAFLTTVLVSYYLRTDAVPF
jgi:hypothetical protein